MPDRSYKFRTVPGAMCTILLMVCVLAYVVFKVQRALMRDEYSLI